MGELAKILSLQNLNKLVVLIGSFLLFGLVFLLIWSSYRGFDFSDESYYHIGYLFHSEIDNSVIFFHRIYNSFFGFLKLTFAQNRVFGVILTLFSSIFIAYSSAAYFEIKEKTQLALFTSILGFIAHSIFPMSVSYNLFSALFTSIIISLTFVYLKRNSIVYIALIGFFLSVLIANKFTNISFALFFFPIVLLFDYFEEKRTIKFYFKSVLIASFGFVMATFFLFHSIEELKASLNGFVYGLSLSTGHSLTGMFERILSDIEGLIFSAKYLLPTFILMLILKLKKDLPSYINIGAVIIINIILLIYLYKGFYGRTAIFSFYFFLILITSSILFFFQKREEKSVRLIALYFVLMLVPFASSIGTNNSLFVQFTFYGNIFAVGLFLLFLKLQNYYLRYFLILITLLISFLNISYNKIYTPYRIDTNLLLQTEEVENIPYLKGLKVDSQTNQKIKQFLSLKKYNATHLFLTSRQLGISLITDKEPLLFTWVDESSFHLIPQLMEQKPALLFDELLIVIPSSSAKMITNQLLKVNKLNFKGNYQLLEKISSENDTLLIYGKF